MGIQRTVDEGLIIRTWVREDAPMLFSLVDRDRKHLGQFLSWVNRMNELTDAEAFLERMIALHNEGRGIRFGIFYQDSLVGAVNFARIGDDVAEMGTWVASWTTGRGIARRASRVAITEAQAFLSVSKVVFHLRTDNLDSRRYITGLGFKFEAVEADAEEHDGHLYDLERYGLSL